SVDAPALLFSATTRQPREVWASPWGRAAPWASPQRAAAVSQQLLAARRRPQSHVGCRLRTLAALLIWAASSMTLAAAADSTTPEAPITSPERALLRTGPSQEVRWE